MRCFPSCERWSCRRRFAPQPLHLEKIPVQPMAPKMVAQGIDFLGIALKSGFRSPKLGMAERQRMGESHLLRSALSAMALGDLVSTEPCAALLPHCRQQKLSLLVFLALPCKAPLNGDRGGNRQSRI